MLLQMRAPPNIQRRHRTTMNVTHSDYHWRMAYCVHCGTLLFNDTVFGWRHEIEPTWPHRAHDLYIIQEEPV
jgi:hypothetical protein